MIIPLSLVVSQKSTMGLEYTGNTKVCVFASSSIDSRHLSSLSRLSDDMVIVVVFVVVVRLSFFSVPFQPGTFLAGPAKKVESESPSCFGTTHPNLACRVAEFSSCPPRIQFTARGREEKKCSTYQM